MVTFKSLKDSRVFQVETIPYSVSVRDKVCLTLTDYRDGKHNDPEIYILEGVVETVEHIAKRIIMSNMDVDKKHYDEYNLVISVNED